MDGPAELPRPGPEPHDEGGPVPEDAFLAGPAEAAPLPAPVPVVPPDDPFAFTFAPADLGGPLLPDAFVAAPPGGPPPPPPATSAPEPSRQEEDPAQLVRPVLRIRPVVDTCPPEWASPAGAEAQPEAPPPSRTSSGRIVARAPARPRLTVHLRCAFCHDHLGAGPTHTCPGCATRVHAECVDENDRCPTLGCTGSAGPRPFKVRIARWANRTLAAHDDRPPTRWRIAARFVGALALPVACFVINEMIDPGVGGLAPRHHGDAKWGWVWDSRVQRFLYPVVLWAVLSYIASSYFGRRGRWIQVGLEGGVVVAGLFSLVYLPLLPISAMMILAFGMGLLGFGPFFALSSYVGALLRYRRAGQADPDAPDLTFPRTVFGLVTGAGLTAAVRTALTLHETLPNYRDNCFVVTAAARGDPRVTGAELVPGPDGVTRPVTRQLRTIKAFELLLVAACPRAHRALRVVYDRVGPVVARRLGPRTATLAWIALLPAQALARLALGLALRDADALVEATYRDRQPPA